jgi:AcrR family transcriptional regulator
VPRVFTTEDRAAIRKSLLDVGREHFLRYGLRKTSVEQLAHEVGIAKGTFYRFFDSKEDLCMEIFENEELEMGKETEAVMALHEDPRETVRALLAYAVDFATSDSLIAVLRESGEYALLARGVRREALSKHINNDNEMAEKLLADLRAKGAICRLGPPTLAGVLRAVVMLTFHEKEIGTDVFGHVMDQIVEWISLGITVGDAE